MNKVPYELDLSRYKAGVFDLDGVVTRTADLHAEAWTKLFDTYLALRAEREGEELVPFDPVQDYLAYVDGKPRYEGVSSFLQSRSISLAAGHASDDPSEETVCGLGNRKNELFNEMLEHQGIEVFESTLNLIRRVRERGLKTALVTSSENGASVLEAAGITDLFDAKVDGLDAIRMQLKGKPDPDVFQTAVDLLGLGSADAFAVEDALSGVQSAKAAGYALVIGIDRSGTQKAAMLECGADVVVSDLIEMRLTQ